MPLGGVGFSATGQTADDDGNNRFERWYSATARAAGYVGWNDYASTNNPRLIAITNVAKAHVIGVVDGQKNSSPDALTPGGAGVANDWVFVKTRGDILMTVPDSAYTAGHALRVAAGVVETTGAAPDGTANQFAVVLVTSGAGTSLKVRLFGREIVST